MKYKIFFRKAGRYKYVYVTNSHDGEVQKMI